MCAAILEIMLAEALLESDGDDGSAHLGMGQVSYFS